MGAPGAPVGDEVAAHRAQRREDARRERHAVGDARARLQPRESPVVHEADLAAPLGLAHAPVVLAHGEGVAAAGLDASVGGDAEVQGDGELPGVPQLGDGAQRPLERLPFHAPLLPADAPARGEHQPRAVGVALPACPKGLEGRHRDPLGLVDDHAHSAGLPSSVISSRSSR